MLILQEINEENFYSVINLQVQEDQKEFVASNARSLAECYLYRNENDIFPFAIIYNETVVGFILTYTDDESKSVTIWRIMIDKKYQHNGYGKRAMVEVEKMFAKSKKYELIYTSYRKNNLSAKGLYQKLGYLEDRINDYGEIVVKKAI